MTSSELYALMECAYELQPHSLFGLVFSAPQRPDVVRKRANYTFVDMQLDINFMRLRQARENITGNQSLAKAIEDFANPSTIAGTPQQQQRVSYLAALRDKGVPFSNLTNKRIRKTDLAVAAAIKKLAGGDPPAALKQSMLQAISSAVGHAAGPCFDRLGISQPHCDLLLLAIDKRIATDVNGRKFGSNFALGTYLSVERSVCCDLKDLS